MTSRALSNNGFKQQFLWNIKSQKWLLLAALVIRILAGVFVSYVNCNVYIQEGAAITDPILIMILNDQTYDLATFAIVLDFVLGLAFNFIFINIFFSYLYSKRKTDLYHGFPVKREAYYFAAVLIPVILNAVSLFAEFGVTAVVSAMYKGVSYVDLSEIFLIYVAIFAILTALTGITALAVSVSGTVVSFIVNCVSFVALVPFTAVYAVIAIRDSVVGFTKDLGAFWNIFPATAMMNLTYDKGSASLIAVISLAVAVVTALAGLFFFLKRKSENSESHPSTNALLYFTVMVGAAFVAIAFSAIRELESGVYIGIAAAVVLSLVAMLVIAFVTQRKIKKSVVFSWLGFSVVLASAMLYMELGTSGYTNRVPTVDEIESVTVSTYVSQNDSVKFLDTFTGSPMEPEFKLEGKEAIEKTVAYHKEALTANMGGSSYYGDQSKITYTLKNGEKVSRVLDKSTMVDKGEEGEYTRFEIEELASWNALTKVDEFAKKMAMPYEKEDLAGIFVSIGSRQVVLTSEEAKALFDAYMADSEAMIAKMQESKEDEIKYDPFVDYYPGADVMYPESEMEQYYEMNLMFFTDTATKAAKEVFVKIPPEAVRWISDTCEAYASKRENISKTSFPKSVEYLEKNVFFETVSPMSEVTDDWQLVVEKAEVYDNGRGGFDIMIYNGNGMSDREFLDAVSGKRPADLVLQIHFAYREDFGLNADRNYLIQKTRTFTPEKGLEEIKNSKTGYFYYFTNGKQGKDLKVTQLYYSAKIK